MRLVHAYRECARRRPDSEHSQALLRAVIVSLFLCYAMWIAARDPGIAGRVWALSIASTLFSVLLLARILRHPHASPRRRVAGAIHDNVAVTLWLYSCGPAGALALFVYPFITVGNGFRFGVRYLACSGFLGAVAIGSLMLAVPGWRAYGIIGVGVLLSHVCVTIYTGVLLRSLHRTREQLAKLATHDALTDLPNRRYFTERLRQLVELRERRPLACFYLDLDGFKAVNDRCGHSVGDRLLQQVGLAIRRCVAPSDLLARVGGDEFTLVIDGPGGPGEAQALAEQIVARIEAITTVDCQPVDISVSVGICYIAAESRLARQHPDAILKAADEAMYAAKRAGRGRCRMLDPDGAPIPYSDATTGSPRERRDAWYGLKSPLAG